MWRLLCLYSTNHVGKGLRFIELGYTANTAISEAIANATDLTIRKC
jgi:hypothetical protein